MTIFYIKMKIRAGGGALGQEGGVLGQQGAPPCYFSLWETLHPPPPPTLRIGSIGQNSTFS